MDTEPPKWASCHPYFEKDTQVFEMKFKGSLINKLYSIINKSELSVQMMHKSHLTYTVFQRIKEPIFDELVYYMKSIRVFQTKPF